jgi:chromosome segregation ATPase
LSGSAESEPLETLVINLARVATDEAAAAAELAGAEAKEEAGRHEAALALERARGADLERAVQEGARQVEAQRLAAAQSNDARARAEARATALATDHADLTSKYEALGAEFARLRAAASEHERAYRELQQRVEAWQAEKETERAAQQTEKDEMKQVLASVKDVFMNFGNQKIAIDKRFQALEDELEQARAALADRARGRR